VVVRVLLYGLGRSGLAAGRLAARQGHAVAWFDRRVDGPDQADASAAGWPRVIDPVASDAEVCIAAPGVPIDHPDLVALRARGVPTIGEVEWVHRTVDAPILGVTGTAGKGTVTRWIERFLHAGGIDAAAGGNLDPALATVAAPGRWLASEMSSFQLERCPTLRLRIAVVTVLGRDHLDRHGDVATYHAVKRRLIEAAGPDGVAILNAADPVQRAWADEHPGRIALYDARGADERDPRARAWIRADRFAVDGEDLGPVTALRPPGRHQHANLLAAALAAREVGVSTATIAATIPTLATAPGRHEVVAERCGVRFVDDSIATRELAVAAALDAARPPVAWIVGGRDKGADPDALRPLLPGRVVRIVGIGEAGPDFVARFADLVPGSVISDPDGATALRRALRSVAETLRAQGGGTVLLAPLAASFDQFRDYAERGRAFRAAVAELLEEAPWTACS
jgi:UDP-N-acetylmuramoylalanine--D-glutamate ligase